MVSLGIGIGLELLSPGAGWPCGRFDATQSRLVAVIAGTQGEGVGPSAALLSQATSGRNFFETDLIKNAPLLESKDL